MQRKQLSTLNRIYQRANRTGFDSETGLWKHRIPETVTAKQLADLEAAGYPPNAHQRFGHDELVERLLAAREKVTLETVTEAFVAGVGGSNPRGRQPLVSYARTVHMPAHDFTRVKGNVSCGVCGARESRWEDATEEKLRRHRGHVWSEFLHIYMLDLEELPRLPAMRPTSEDQKVFRALLEHIAAAPAEESPSALQKRLSKAKALPKTDKYKRYGILIGLAEVGVLPNRIHPSCLKQWFPESERWTEHKQLGRSHRSDLPWPLSGWRGELGIDTAVVEELFGTRL